MSWIKDVISPSDRSWEEIYRNRHQHDKVVRSTHGVNCTGSCSWNIHVKNGVVALETQAIDYPKLSCDVPGYEPRGCQRGVTASTSKRSRPRCPSAPTSSTSGTANSSATGGDQAARSGISSQERLFSRARTWSGPEPTAVGAWFGGGSMSTQI